MIARVGVLVVVAATLAACGKTPGYNLQVPLPSGQATMSTADNRASALAESKRLLTVLSPPAGGRVVDASPAADLRDELEGISPSDSMLSRHAWWTVPLSPGDFAAWLRSQHVAGMTVEDGGASSAPDGTMVDIADLDGTGTSAYSAPVLTFAYVPHDGGTAVRLDTFLAARYARTTYLPTDVSRIVIRRVTSSVMSSARRQVRTTVVTDPARIRRLVTAANRLPGIVTVPNIFHCPMMRTVTSARVTFTSASGVFAIDGPATVCGAVLTLSKDGHRVPPALDPGRAWFPLLGI
ncbi:MAG TPA: hypothetical protein VN088_14125 [Nocardioides sp.]|nr:hypothetical protein [Nocardioides sp.]